MWGAYREIGVLMIPPARAPCPVCDWAGDPCG